MGSNPIVILFIFYLERRVIIERIKQKCARGQRNDIFINCRITSDGTLFVFDHDNLIAEIADCEGMSGRQYNNIIEETVENSDYMNKTYGKEKVQEYLRSRKTEVKNES